MGSLLNDVNILIRKGLGDLSRLEHIKETIENNKQLYNFDRNYVDLLIKNYIVSTEQKDDENTILEDEASKNTLSKNISENEQKLKQDNSSISKSNDLVQNKPKPRTGLILLGIVFLIIASGAFYSNQ